MGSKKGVASFDEVEVFEEEINYIKGFCTLKRVLLRL